MTYVLWVVYFSQLWGTSRVSGSALQSQGKPAAFASSPIWRTILFPNAPKGKYKRGTTSWCGYLKRFEMEQGLLLEIVMMTTNHSTGAKELREKCWLCPSSTLGCGRKQMHWLARVILNEAFSPKSTMTLTRVFEDPLLLIYFGILISLWPSFYVNHYAHKQELRDNILVLPSLRSCKLNTFVLLLVNQQCCFAIDMH